MKGKLFTLVVGATTFAVMAGSVVSPNPIHAYLIRLFV